MSSVLTQGSFFMKILPKGIDSNKNVWYYVSREG